MRTIDALVCQDIETAVMLVGALALMLAVLGGCR